MDRYQIRGKIDKVFDLNRVSDKFRKREFILEVTSSNERGTFVDFLKFQAVQNNCEILDGVNKGDLVAVTWAPQGRKWKKNNEYQYFTNLEAFDVVVVSRRDGTGAEDSIDDQLPLGMDGDDPFAVQEEEPNRNDRFDEAPDDLPF